MILHTLAGEVGNSIRTGLLSLFFLLASVQTGIDIPNDVFGGTLTEIGQSNMPAGGSPANQNVEFLPGLVRTRGGLQPNTSYAAIAGGPWQVRYSKSFGVIPESQQELAVLWNPTTKAGFLAGSPTSTIGPLYGYGNATPWNPSVVDPNFTGPLAKSFTQFSREYIGISQGRYGWDIPRQWDGKNFDRVSQCGPGASPTPSDYLPLPQNIPAAPVPISATIAAPPTGAVRGNEIEIHHGFEVEFVDTTITFTTTAPHGFSAGQMVTISGCSSPSMNTTFVIQSVTTLTFVVLQQNANLGETAGNGTATVNFPSISRFGNIVTVLTLTPHGFQPGWTAVISGVANTLAGTSIASIAQSNGIVTVTTTTPHGLISTGQVIIAGVTDGTYNGQFQILFVVNATTFTYAAVTANPSSTGGTVSTTFNGTFPILAVPSATSFTYSNVGPNQSGTGTMIGPSSTTAASVATNIATLTFAANPGFSVGQLAIVSGFTGADSFLNGSFPITAASTTGPWTISYNLIHATWTATSNGSVSADEALASIQGNISAGLHQISICFITRQGYITRPAPPASFSAAGGHLLSLTNIPTGPANVVARLILATIFITPPATTSDFFSIRGPNVPAGNLFQINDNTTTAVSLDFTDSQLAAGFSADYLFDLVELGEVAAFTSYSGRLFAWGELNSVGDLLNMEFNGGWNIAGGFHGSDLPLGWTSDPTNGAGGSRVAGGGVFGDAYEITIATGEGMLTQGVFADAFGSPILSAGIRYGARITALASATGQMTVEFFSPSLGSLALVNLTGFGASFQTLMGSMNAPLPAVLPQDMVLRMYASAGIGTVTIDRVSLYPVNNSINTTVVRASRFTDPESFDGVLGLLQPIYANGEAVRAVVPLRDSLYIVCDRSLYVTKDTGGEPATWTIDPVSSSVGCVGPNAVGIGEDWIVKANRYGLYIYLGREPQKISHEIQTLWNEINWSAAGKLWVTVDPTLRRVYIGAPVNGSSEVNQIFVMSYETLDTSDMIAQYGTLRFSPYTGRRLILEQGRKWTVWNFVNSSGQPVTAPCGSLVEQSDGTAKFLLGGNVDNNIYFIDPTNRGNDDGAAVTSSYTIHFFPTSDEEQQFQLRSHMHGFSFSRWYVSGAGDMDIYVYENNTSDTDPKRYRVRMKNPPEFDEEITIDDAKAERWSMKFQSTELDGWFQVERMTRTVEPDKNELVRGTNYQ